MSNALRRKVDPLMRGWTVQCVALTLTALAGAAPAYCAAEQATPADALVDSVGINVHLHYTDTLYYNNFPLVLNSLRGLGVRHVRDGLQDTTLQAYYDRHNQLAAYGIHGLFIANEQESMSLLQQWPGRVSASFEGYEAPNEADNPARAGWMTNLRNFIGPLYTTAQRAGFPVVGPSITNTADFKILGSVSAYETFGNMHNYPAGRYPGNPGWEGGPGYSNYGSIAWNIQMLGYTSPGRPLWTTETGYTNDSSSAGVSEAASAIYLPRLLMMQWLSGVHRTYLYELLSTLGQDYGLLRSNGSVKPAFGAVSALTSLLNDPGPGFTAAPLDFTLTGGDSNLKHLLLQKRDGSYYLALWLEVNSYDPNGKKLLSVTPEQVLLSVPHAISSATLYHWTAQGTTTASTLASNQAAPLAVDDKLTIVKLSLGSGWRLNTVISPPGAGAVTLYPASSDQNYAPGQTVTLTATPALGYAFQGYSGAVSSNANIAMVTGASSTTVTANFACQYALTPSSLSVSGGGGTASVPVQTGSGCPIAATSSAAWLAASAVASQGSGSLQLSYAANPSGPRSALVTLGAAALTVQQAAGGSNVSVGLTTIPAGGKVYVDGGLYSTPATLSWAAGSIHTLQGLPVQSLAGVAYVANGWVSGGSATTLTAVALAGMNIQERLGAAVPLTVNAAQGGRVMVWPDPAITNSYYRLGQRIGIAAYPASGCSFAGFSGTAASGTNMAYIVMNQPATETAHFNCTSASVKK